MSAPATLPAPLAQHPRIAQWIALDRDGEVGVLTGRVELGQGNLTAIAQLAAEELCVDFARVRITGADTGLTPNEGFTAGSLSMTAGGQSVRLAAAAARELLLAEAARLLQRGADTLEIRDGHVLADGMETDLTLWALAARVPLDVAAAPHARPLPAAARRRAPPPRADLAERIAGAPFVHDFAPAGMLHGRPIHPPSLGARLASLDTDALAARPGVLDVVRDGSFVGILAAREEDAIAAARWGAARAAWTRGAAPDTPPQAHIAASDEPAEQIETRGDPAAAGGRRFATTVSRPYLSHGSIGPSCAVARWDGDDLTVWTHAQGVYPLRDALAMVFGIDAARIRCIHMPGAGCYGHNGADDVALDAALLARAVPGRPVRVLWSRADEFGCAPLGPAMVTEAVAHVDGDGRLAAMRVAAMSAPHGNRPGRNGAPNLRAAAYLAQPFPVPRSADIPPAMGGGADRNAVPPYKVPNLAVTKKVVQDLPWRTSSLRGLGAFLNVYAIETLIDDIAAGLGADPVDYRLRHLDHDPRGAEVIRRAAAAAGWPGQPADEGRALGLGFARYKNTAAWCAVVVEAEVAEDVRLTRAWAAVDAGEAVSPDGIVNQIEGGLIQSASWTLKEAVRLEGDGVASLGWEDYPILRFREVPVIAVEVIDRPDQPMLGCAEAAQGPTAAAIGNAVARALGVRVRALPLTREAIIDALA